MTLPRPVLPKKTYLVTRRCSERRFFLIPGPGVNSAFLYVLGLYARTYGIKLHAVVVLSNHYHCALTDTEGKLPAFMERFNSLLGRFFNARLGRRESFWSNEKYSRVELADPDAVLDKILYVLANPVEAGLVERGETWPGVRLAPGAQGPPRLRVKRPGSFFRNEENGGSLPREVEIVCEPPPGFEDLDAAAFGELLERKVLEREGSLREKARAQGRTFLGPKKVLAQSPQDAPSTQQPFGKTNPRVATKNKRRRIEVLSRLKRWLVEYREAFARYVAGEQNGLFPAGTYWLRLHLGVPTRSPETAPLAIPAAPT